MKKAPNNQCTRIDYAVIFVMIVSQVQKLAKNALLIIEPIVTPSSRKRVAFFALCNSARPDRFRSEFLLSLGIKYS